MLGSLETNQVTVPQATRRDLFSKMRESDKRLSQGTCQGTWGHESQATVLPVASADHGSPVPEAATGLRAGGIGCEIGP